MNQHRKRVKHYDLAGQAHFLTSSCRHRLPLLSDDRTRHWLLDSLNKARSGYRFDLTNPVRRGLVERPTDWLWSSARDWAGLDGAWLKVDRTLLTLHPDGQ